MRKIVILCAGLLAASVADAQIRRPTDVFYEEGGAIGRGSISRFRHSGDAGTLPYGHVAGWEPGIARHAETMPSVQYAMQRMEERGYIRRADLDVGMGANSYATAVLAYEKPGVPASEAFPVITVTTQPFYVSRQVRWVPATQVACGLFRDSSGVLIPTESPSDSAILISGANGTGQVPAEELIEAIAGAQVERDYDDFVWRYTTYEAHNPQDWWGTMSPGNQYIWRQYGGTMAISIGQAALVYGPGWVRPPPFGAGGGVYACAVAATAAHYRFWLHPPDTSHVGR